MGNGKVGRPKSGKALKRVWVTSAQAKAIDGFMQQGKFYTLPEKLDGLTKQFIADFAPRDIELELHKAQEEIAALKLKISSMQAGDGSANQLTHLVQQLTMQTTRADQAEADLDNVRIERDQNAKAYRDLLEASGTEKQRAYSAMLDAKIAAAQHKPRNEFDQT